MVSQRFKIGNKLTILCAAVSLFSGCALDSSNTSDTVPEHDKQYGIYSMDLVTSIVKLIYSSDNSLGRVHENHLGTKLIFQEDFGDDIFHDSEICLININGLGYQRITNNTWLDAYPSWSPDGTKILYLSWPDYPTIR